MAKNNVADLLLEILQPQGLRRESKAAKSTNAKAQLISSDLHITKIGDG